jgi:hypothetical protein
MKIKYLPIDLLAGVPNMVPSMICPLSRNRLSALANNEHISILEPI